MFQIPPSTWNLEPKAKTTWALKRTFNIKKQEMIQDHELKGEEEVKLNPKRKEKAKHWTAQTHIAQTRR